MIYIYALGANPFYYTEDAIMVDPTMSYPYQPMYYNGLQVDESQLKEFVKNQM